MRVLAVDLDGTLLSGNEIPSSVASAIKVATKNGITVVIVTGRPPMGAARFVEALELEGPLVSYGGGLITHGKRKIFERRIDFETGNMVIEIGRKFGLCPLVFSGEELICESHSLLEEYFENSGVMGKIGAASLFAGGFNKLLFIGEHEVLEDIKREIDVKVPAVRALFSWENYLECIPADVGKGKALEVLSQYLGVPLSSFIAVGDSDNDVDMFERAGLSVAVANGSRLAKEKADYVAPYRDGAGVVWAIEKFCLGR